MAGGVMIHIQSPCSPCYASEDILICNKKWRVMIGCLAGLFLSKAHCVKHRHCFRQLYVGHLKWPVNRSRSWTGGNQDAVFPTERFSCSYKFCNPRNMNTKYLNLLWWLEIQEFFTAVQCQLQWAGGKEQYLGRWLCRPWFMASSISDHRIKAENNNPDLWVMQACQNYCAWILNTTF